MCILPYFNLRVEFFFSKQMTGIPKSQGRSLECASVCLFVCLFDRGTMMSSSLEFNLIYC